MTDVVGFDMPGRPRVVFGIDAVDRLGALAAEAGMRRALVVTDAHIAAAGHAARARRALESAGLEVHLFEGVVENPGSDDVETCAAFARGAGIDGLVGLGGGSCMDTAKGANFLLSNGGRMQDYWGTGKATRPMLPLIAVPTTAGTGSECQSYALIVDEKTHQKMACGDPKAAARVALLDPTLTLSQPRGVTANTGMDAITHAVETAVTRRRTELSWLHSREAFRLLTAALPQVLERPGDVEARARMQLGAAFAGMAIEESMLGAAHSCANPLTGRFGVVHGQAVAMMLPHVVRFNAGEPAAREAYAELAGSAEALASRLEELRSAAGMAASLSECGVPPGAIPSLAAEAATQWTAQFNPRRVGPAEFEALYQSAVRP